MFPFKALKFFLIIIAVNLSADNQDCSFKQSDYISDLMNPSSLESISIMVPKSNKWNKNLFKIVSSKSQNIESKYRKNFDASIQVRYKFGECTFPAKVRVSGDWKDHITIDQGEVISSLNIKLKTGNILNAVSFKLLIPNTRNGINEVLGSLLFKELGFISPKTFFVSADINNASGIFLFQENAEKEMLERNLRRESAIFEGSEHFLWSFRDYDEMELEDISLAKLDNTSWAAKGNTSFNIALNAFLEMQRIYMHYSDQKMRTYNPRLGDNFRNYSLALLAMNGEHGLYPHNMKFYYDSFNQNFEPIYYDGDLNLLLQISTSSLSRRVDLNSYFNENSIASLKDIKNKIEALAESDAFYNSFKEHTQGLSDFKDFFTSALAQSIVNLDILINYNQSKNIDSSLGNYIKPYDWEHSKNKYLDKLENHSLEDFLVFVKGPNQDNNSYRFLAFKVGESEFKEIYLGINDILDIVNKKKFQSTPADILPFETTLSNDVVSQAFLNGQILFSENMKVDIDYISRKLMFTQSFPSDWALVKDVHLVDWELVFQGKPWNETSIQQEQRFNLYGQTGCINLFNILFEDVSINSSNGGCEDSINIISSRGNIKAISIYQAFADALDIDFSNVSLNNVLILDALNDCFDVSGGSYIIGSAQLVNCGDKGISVGEKSELIADQLQINNSDIGVSSKDFSKTTINNIELDNVRICAEAFQKKQEFGGAMISISNIQGCNYGYENDLNSSIYLNNNELP